MIFLFDRAAVFLYQGTSYVYGDDGMYGMCVHMCVYNILNVH